MTFDNFKKLYIYFASHAESLCECCKNNIECKGEKCSCYQVFEKVQDEQGNDFFYNRPLTCLDLDFGDCQLYEGTKCYDCIHSATGYDGFEWNGKVID